MTWSSDRWFRVLVWTAATLAVLTLVRLGSLAGLEVQRNYNEGWNAYHALAAMGGGMLYPRPPSLMFNNYPPLSFYLVGWAGKLVGDPIVAGRVLSLLATLVASWSIFAIARRMDATKTEALFAAVLFLAKLLAASTYVGIDDPQMLAHAFGCLGLLVAIGAPPTQRRLAFAALLLTLAVFTKHMLVIQPLVLLIWFGLYDRIGAIRFAAYGLLFALLGLLLCRIALGVDLAAMLFTPRTYEIAWLVQSLDDFLLVSFAPLAAGLYLLFVKDRYAVLLGLYTVAAFGIGLAFDGGAGVGRNALFDAAIAGALSAAFVVHRLHGRAPVWALVFALACLVPPAVAALQKAEPAWATRAFWLAPMKADAAAAKTDIAFIRNRPGPAMCERLTFCYRAGKAPEVDAFNFIEAVKTHRRDAQDLVRLLDRRYFSTIELGQKPRLDALPDVVAAIRRNYRVDHANGDGIFFIPRGPAL